jgi:hypothetical protein
VSFSCFFQSLRCEVKQIDCPDLLVHLSHQWRQLSQIKSIIEDNYAVTHVIDKDLQDGLEAVNKFHLLRAKHGKMNPWANAETKRREEWDAIHSIFSTETHSIQGFSRPDFIVTRKADNYTVGVEVTSLYFHMGSARLKRDTRYLQQVLDGNPHPLDVTIMRKDTIVLLDQTEENGNEISFEAVLYDHVGWTEFIYLLGQEIDKKSKKYTGYQGPVSRISLIVVDEENFFSSWNIDQVSVYLFQLPAFKEMVTACVFHEVFLITNVNGDKSYIPLKQALFFADYKTIVSFYYRKLMPEVGLEKIISVFIYLMIRSGHSNMKAFREAEKVFFVHQNLLIQIDKEKLRQEFMRDSALFDFLDPVSKIVSGQSDQPSEFLYTDYMEFKKDKFPLLNLVIHKLATE